MPIHSLTMYRFLQYLLEIPETLFIFPLLRFVQLFLPEFSFEFYMFIYNPLRCTVICQGYKLLTVL